MKSPRHTGTQNNEEIEINTMEQEKVKEIKRNLRNTKRKNYKEENFFSEFEQRADIENKKRLKKMEDINKVRFAEIFYKSDYDEYKDPLFYALEREIMLKVLEGSASDEEILRMITDLKNDEHREDNMSQDEYQDEIGLLEERMHTIKKIKEIVNWHNDFLYH